VVHSVPAPVPVAHIWLSEVTGFSLVIRATLIESAGPVVCPPLARSAPRDRKHLVGCASSSNFLVSSSAYRASSGAIRLSDVVDEIPKTANHAEATLDVVPTEPQGQLLTVMVFSRARDQLGGMPTPPPSRRHPTSSRPSFDPTSAGAQSSEFSAPGRRGGPGTRRSPRFKPQPPAMPAER
jgi:hypothetical protein